MRLSEELRERTRAFASSIVRCYADLPRDRKEADESAICHPLRIKHCVRKQALRQEANEIIAIFTAITLKVKERSQ